MRERASVFVAIVVCVLSFCPVFAVNPPDRQSAVAGNHQVSLTWRAISNPGNFSHYAVYRATSAFTSTVGKTPIRTLPGIGTESYVDGTALNGQKYYYAVTAVFTDGSETTNVTSVGPRKPRDESDLQVTCIARTPRYPRYLPNYTYYTITEPSGFGPYIFSAATSLGGGQTGGTKRWPNVGETVTYTASIRNRGTNPWSGLLSGTWRVDGAVYTTTSASVTLQPGDVTTHAITMTWDGAMHDITFTVDVADVRPANNSAYAGSKAAPFLTYCDVGAIEQFRDGFSPSFPNRATDDLIDWLQRHAAKMNEMFALAGSPKRVYYDILATTADYSQDPNVNRTPFAIFPFRYYVGSFGDPRGSGYYHANDDIDYGLCHEMSHQLGLIDIYQLDVGPSSNLVSGMGYTARACLMHGCSPFYSDHSAGGMTKWANIVHGYYGQYLYDIPSTVRMRFLDYYGKPLAGANVKMYQYVERPGVGKVISTQVKAEGATDATGLFPLPNVPINPALVPDTPAGELHDNPFGYVAVVGTNGVLHFRIEKDGFVDYAWLDITECNLAYWAGQTTEVTFDRQLAIGGSLQRIAPKDMAELNVQNWSYWAQDGTIALTNDTAFKKVGQASIKGVFTGGFDNYVRYPLGIMAKWDLAATKYIHLWAYAINPHGFQEQSPRVRIGGYLNGYYQYTPNWDVLNNAIGQWYEFIIPLTGDSTWTRTQFGAPDLTEINYLEIHADTWDSGFTMWIDGVGFDFQGPPKAPPPTVKDR